MILPRRLSNNQQVGPNWANSVVDYLRAITPGPSTDILVQQGANRTTFALAKKTRAGGVSFEHPFKLYNASNAEDGLRVGVVPGTIGNVWPAGMETAGVEYALAVTGSGSVWAGGTVDGDTIITSVYLDTTEPTQTNTVFKLLIGIYTVDGTKLTVQQSVQGSQGYLRCLQLYTSPLTYSHQFSLI